MGELIDETKGLLESTLNSHNISMDSIEGIIIIFALAFIAWGIYKQAMKWVKWSLAVILFCEFMYWLGQTSFNNLIPVGEVFRYDILTAIAQVFVGTKVCEALLWIDAFIRSVCITVWGFIEPYAGKIAEGFENMLHTFGEHIKENVEPISLPETTPTPTPVPSESSVETTSSMVIYYLNCIPFV